MGLLGGCESGSLAPGPPAAGEIDLASIYGVAGQCGWRPKLLSVMRDTSPAACIIDGSWA